MQANMLWFSSVTSSHTSCCVSKQLSMGYKLISQAAASAITVIATLLLSVAHCRLSTTPPAHKHKSQVLPIRGAAGPESLAFDRAGGGPYTGVSDGRIIKWDARKNHWIDFAVTTPHRFGCEGSHDQLQTEPRCGRPLGLSFYKKTGDLYIADAYMGLLRVGPKGGLATPVATKAQGVPFKFTNAVVVNQRNGVVYFTDTSTVYQRRDYFSALLSGDKTGRLMKFDPKTKRVTVLLDNLMFPNGVALGKKGNYLLVVESTNSRVLKYWLKPRSKAGKVEVFAELPGLPDNIQRNHRCEYWVAINAIKINSLKEGFSMGQTSPVFDGLGMGVKLSQNGTIVQVLEDKEGKVWRYSSEVHEKKGNLWIGSVVVPYVARLESSA